MEIVFVESYFGGSHRQFIQEWSAYLKKNHPEIHSRVFSLPSRHWRWRLQGGHLELAQQINNELEASSNRIFILSSMLDSASFKGLLKKELAQTPVVTFFHENQLAYPLNEKNKSFSKESFLQNFYFPGLHLNQILASDLCLFNSSYNRETLFQGIQTWLKKMPDYRNTIDLAQLKKKTAVTYLAVKEPPQLAEELVKSFSHRPKRMLWNHRWEYDKNPKEFLDLATAILKEDKESSLDLLGQKHAVVPQEFTEIYEKFPEQISQWGPVAKKDSYFQRLLQCRVLPVTSRHDFFGLSTVEAIRHGVLPILPHDLSYPELIPEELHPELLYSTPEERYAKTQNLLNKGLDPKSHAHLLRYSSQFSWESRHNDYMKKITPLVM